MTDDLVASLKARAEYPCRGTAPASVVAVWWFAIDESSLSDAIGESYPDGLAVDEVDMRDEDPKIRQAMRDALVHGDKLRAIKLLREASGNGLKEAKERVEQLMRAAGSVEQRARVDEPAHSSLETPRTLPAAAMSALQQGHKIEAIRLTREHYGLGLKEAKELVDAQQVTVVGDREIPPYQVTSGGGVWRVLLFIALAIAGYFWFFGGA